LRDGFGPTKTILFGGSHLQRVCLAAVNGLGSALVALIVRKPLFDNLDCVLDVAACMLVFGG